MSDRFAIAIETSTKSGGVAIAAWNPGMVLEESFIRERRLPAEAAHASLLLPLLQELLDSQGAKPSQIALIAVGVGPGSYTGLRVGIATALGLAQAGSIPLAAIGSLAAVAEESDALGPIALLANAYGGEMYLARFERSEETLREIAPIALVPKDQAAAQIPPNYKVLEDIPARPATVLRLGVRRFLESGADAPQNVRPLYLRPSRAEIQFKKV